MTRTARYAFFVAAAAASLGTAGFAWWFWSDAGSPPPACAEKIDAIFVKRMVVAAFLKSGISSSDADAFKVAEIFRDPAEDWPTYHVRLVGKIDNEPFTFVGVGNGCGIHEWFELGGAR